MLEVNRCVRVSEKVWYNIFDEWVVKISNKTILHQSIDVNSVHPTCLWPTWKILHFTANGSHECCSSRVSECNHFFVLKNVSSPEILKELQFVFKEQCPGKSTVYYWISEFKGGCQDVQQDFSRVGRPQEIPDTKISLCDDIIGQDRRITIRSLFTQRGLVLTSSNALVTQKSALDSSLDFSLQKCEWDVLNVQKKLLSFLNSNRMPFSITLWQKTRLRCLSTYPAQNANQRNGKRRTNSDKAEKWNSSQKRVDAVCILGQQGNCSSGLPGEEEKHEQRLLLPFAGKS